MAAMNSYMLPHGTRCSARPLLATEHDLEATPTQVSTNAARSHGPCGPQRGLAAVAAARAGRGAPSQAGSRPGQGLRGTGLACAACPDAGP